MKEEDKVHGSSDRRVSPFRFVFSSTSGLSEDGENRAGRSVFVSRFKIPSGALQEDSQYEGITGNRGRYRKKNNGVCTGDLPVRNWLLVLWRELFPGHLVFACISRTLEGKSLLQGNWSRE